MGLIGSAANDPKRIKNVRLPLDDKTFMFAPNWRRIWLRYVQIEACDPIEAAHPINRVAARADES
jgi:hypothetical protein